MSHTPGPWKVGAVPGNTGKAREILSASRCIAWTASTWDDDMGDVVTAEDDANACLIAAAPDMLKALQLADNALDYAQAQVDSERDAAALRSWRRDVQRAIAIATGTQETTVRQ